MGEEALIPFDSIVNTTRASFAAIESLKKRAWIDIDLGLGANNSEKLEAIASTTHKITSFLSSGTYIRVYSSFTDFEIRK